MRILIVIAATLASLALPAGTAIAADRYVLYDGGAAPAIVHDDAGAPPLSKAADMLARDLAALTGKTPTVARTLPAAPAPVVVIGLATSPTVARLLKANGIDPSPIAGKWESYGRAVVNLPGGTGRTALVIFGSDVRGTIWGVVDLSRALGVSPWQWWADVTITPRDRLTTDGALFFSKPPSVKYRALFINDEEFGLWPWAANTNDPKLHDIGPKTYARVFELMWRLKANTIWPAMRGIEKSFNQINGNAALAASYAIVRASSHVEMMTRTNIREWDAKTMGPYDFVTNKQRVLDYWRQGVRMSAPYETMYTIGMRGIEDRPMQGANTPSSQARLLEQIFGYQRQMLKDELKKPLDEIPQVFTPYKEVLPAYDSGLKVPDDVTITWPDDNFGYLRRLSNAKERARSGGSGIYYHISYWGYPMSYLLLANTHPALMWEETDKAYRFGAHRLWVLNVGDIKPGEYLTQLFFDMAFDHEAFPDIASVRAHLRDWTATNFAAANGDRIAPILWKQYNLAFDRRPSFMGWTKTKPATPVSQTKFSIDNFGDQNARRRDAYVDLEKRIDAIEADIPAARRDAYYELVKFPVEIAADINKRQLDLDKSIAYGYQHRASANSYAAAAKAAQDDMAAAGKRYNDDIAGGKWHDVIGMDPHGLQVYKPLLIPHWQADDDAGGCAIQAEGGGIYDASGETPGGPPLDPHLMNVGAPELPSLHPELGGDRYVDIFLKSAATIGWSATVNQPWITVSRTSGTLDDGHLEQRVHIAVDWAKAPAGGGSGLVTFACRGSDKVLPVTVVVAPPVAVPGVSFIEADRIVSMDAGHADATTKGWTLLDGLGHTGAVLRSDLDTPSIDPADRARLAAAPRATWRFATTTDDDPATLKVIALPFLPVTSENEMRAAVSIDGGPIHVLDFAAPEFSRRWQRHVLDNQAVETIPGLNLKPGAHQVTVYALDPGFALDRLEVDFTGAPQGYGPVPETRIRQGMTAADGGARRDKAA